MRALLDQFATAIFGIFLFSGALCSAKAQLNVTYGPAGVQTLSYGGTTLEDLSVSPNDAFHIWHMKLTDMSGNVLTGQYDGWGETNTGKSWDAATQAWTYNFPWGTITVQFVQHSTSLDMVVHETNQTNSGVILDGVSIYPFALHFPTLPAGFMDASYSQLAFNTTGPSVTTADFGAGEVISVVPNAQSPLYSGFQPTGKSNVYTPLISSTTPDGLATFQPHNDRPVQPGQTATFVVSLRFAPSGTPAAGLSTDAYSSWATTWPAQLNWTDRRAIGTVYLASSPASSDASHPGGYPNNPRRYFNDANASDFDVTTPAGLVAFQARILTQAQNNVQNMQRLGAQGAITWDIEGEQFPQATSYVCQPDSIATVAPEMESTVSDPASAYYGLKLDDAYFKIMTNAGFRVGVCVRPQHFTLAVDGTATQVYLPDSSIVAELTRKIKYAHDRWGATLFYIDSTVEPDGAILDAGLMQQVAASFPDSLLMPEESTPKDYAYTAPFQSYIFHGALGTDPGVRLYYPRAFSAILVNDADSATLATNVAALTASVEAGDLLMAHVDYWQSNNPLIVSIYESAGMTSSLPPVQAPELPPVTPPSPVLPIAPVAPVPPVVPTPPTGSSRLVFISSPASGASISGLVVVNGSVGINLDAAGSYLMVDGTEIGTARVTAAPFSYKLDTSVLTAGTHTLQLWAHDQNNEVLLSSVITVTVTGAAPPDAAPPPLDPKPTPAAPNPVASPPAAVTILSLQNGQAVSGVIQVSAIIGVQLDAAGSYLMVDGQEVGAGRLTGSPYLYALDTSLLTPGPHKLQVWAHDTGNESLVSAVVTVIVSP